MLLRHVERPRVACIVGASRRPQYLEQLGAIADALALPLFVQPRRSSTEYPAFADRLGRIGADSLLCNSYSMLIPEDFLDRFNGRALNIHAALLPRNRGPNPVQWSIIRGDDATGVTAHLMGSEFDAGPIVGQRAVAIDLTDTWVSLSEKLQRETEALLAALIPSIYASEIVATPQDERLATKNERLTPASPKIDFVAMSDRQIYDLIRAQIAPLEGAFAIDARGHETRFKELVPLEEIAVLREQFAEPPDARHPD
jgi:methionyl-tRNA formyltransferase